MAGRLEVRVVGGDRLLRGMRQAAIATADLREPMGRIAGEFRELQADQFARGGPPGRKWRRNRPRYRRLKGGKPVGVFSGRLRRSLVLPGSAYAVERRGPRWVTVGTRARHASLFAGGRTYPGGKIPGRPLLRVVTPAVRIEWSELLVEHLEDILGGAGLRIVQRRRRRRRR